MKSSVLGTDTGSDIILIPLSDGRAVAIKRIQTKTFSLSKAVREEVKQVR